ncbi:sulfotransferase family protein [Streptomyces sp. NPDC088116]|uniref:sulfotransferase family protein n=1 Tax=Streptomyces sp. NPDC088116 TaxID=3365825 RepID=UPI00380FC129
MRSDATKSSSSPRTAPPIGGYRLPWLIRSVNRLLDPAGNRLWPVEAAELADRARAKTGLTDFGDIAPFEEPLEILCRSANQEVDLSAFGRLMVRRLLTQPMVHRLRLTELAAKRPELFEKPVSAPLFVVGMPRSGTTFLHRTMARDHAWYHMPFWESLEPIPAGGTSRGSGPDPRVRTGERFVRAMSWTFPGFVDSHEIANDEPEEEMPLLDAAHVSLQFGFGYFPEYARWYTEADHSGGYRLLRQYLQAMQADRPDGGRWLLKTPTHLEMLRPLVTVFDDATVVQTHRDPISSLVSLAALSTFSTGMLLRNPDLHHIGGLCADYIERALRSMVDYRDSAEGIANKDRFVDVSFGELVGDPIGTVTRISSAVGHEPDDIAMEEMRAFTAKKDGHRSRQRFTMEDFGLDKNELRERFKFYYERFDVPMDRA